MVLNRPKAMNAMSARFVRELHQILDVLQYPVTRTEQIKDVRVLILRGEGAAFCAGYDLKDSTMSKANTPFLQNAFSGLIKKLRETLREFLKKNLYFCLFLSFSIHFLHFVVPQWRFHVTLSVSEKTLSETGYNFQLSAFRPIALQ